MTAGRASARAQGFAFRNHAWLLWFLAPIAVCFVVYRPAVETWFFMDDYAWLGLGDEVRGLGDLIGVLFRPQAQGTIRVFSERVFFMALRSLFGIEAAPFRAVIFGTVIADLVLIGFVTKELTRSRAAAAIAPLVWVVNSALVVPVSWISCYNEVLWAFCLLGAFYCFLRYERSGDRRWATAQWAVYLFGFGVLELNVLYPAIVLWYLLCCSRERWKRALPLFIPALLFTAAHFFFVPRSSGPLYRMYFDADLPRTLWGYLWTGLGPSQVGTAVEARYALAAYVLTGLIIASVFGFVLLGVLRRDLRPLFFIGWCFLVLAPVLPLKNHRSEYYLTVPLIGFAMLAGLGFVLLWEWRRWAGGFVLSVLAGYGVGMAAQSQPQLEWRRDASLRLRTLVEGVAAAKQRHPSADVVLLHGIDWDTYAAGFNDQPFRLYGARHVFLTPTNYEALEKSPQPLRGLMDYHISPGEAVRSLDSGRALVLQPTASGVRNVTAVFKGIAKAQFKPSAPRHIDVGLPASEGDLGPTWYPVENGFRWMPDRATVRMAAPQAGERLYLKGFVPKPTVSQGPLTFTVRVNEEVIGTAKFVRGDEQLSLDFPLPASAAAKDLMDVELSVDHTFTQPTDPRRLGVIFGALEIK